VKTRSALSCLMMSAFVVAMSVHAADQPFKPSGAKTSKPNLLGETRTLTQGGTTWSPGRISSKSTTTLPSTNKR